MGVAPGARRRGEATGRRGRCRWGGHPPALRARARHRRGGVDPRSGAGRGDRPRAPRGAARLPAGVGRRAPRHACGGELGARRPGRAPCRGHGDRPRRLGRRDAAEPRAARDRRAVRYPRGAPPRAHRPGHRPRAGDRPTHRAGPPAHGGPRSGAVPRGPGRADRLLHRRRRPSAGDAGARLHAGAVAARLEPVLGGAGGAPRPAVLLRPSLQPPVHRAGARALPGVVPAVGGVPGAPRHGGRRGGVRSRRRAGSMGGRAGCAVRPPPSHEPPPAAAEPRHRGGVPLHPRGAGDRRAGHGHPRGRRAGDRTRRSRSARRPHGRRRAHGHDARPRARRPAAVVRAPGGGLGGAGGAGRAPGPGGASRGQDPAPDGGTEGISSRGSPSTC